MTPPAPEPEPDAAPPPAGDVFRAAAVDRFHRAAGRPPVPPTFEDRRARQAFWAVAAVPLVAAAAAFFIRVDERASGPVRFDAGTGHFTLLVSAAPDTLIERREGGLEGSRLRVAGRDRRITELAVTAAGPAEVRRYGFPEAEQPAALVTGRIGETGTAQVQDPGRVDLILRSERLLVVLARPLFGGSDAP